MKFVCVSDTHGKVNAEDIPPGDVLVHAGDATMSGSVSQTKQFGEWLESLGFAHIVFVPGNHDRLFEENPEKARGLLPPNVTVLIGATTLIGKVAIHGDPRTPRFGPWAFMTDADVEWVIPPGLDLLVTHGPPYGWFDAVPRGTRSQRVGCPVLLEAVKKAHPRHHLFGHIHEWAGCGMDTTAGTAFHNVAMLDERYRRVEGVSPLILDLEP